MATTNSTANYELSQYVGSDVTSYLTNYNSDMTKIDAQMKRNADSAATANDNATIAVSTATSAASDASTALSTANTASSTASSAQTAAQEAQTAAGAAQTDAANALRASASNSIENLAPAYDPTLTYNVGDLVTYIDENNSGKLYKCIVAVTTPEAFNINKWDDVTTSEVYAPHKKIVAELTTDGIMTWFDVYKNLISQLDINSDLTSAEIYYAENNKQHSLMRFATCGVNSIVFSSISPSTNLIQMTTLEYNFTTEEVKQSNGRINSDNTVTFTAATTSSSAPAGMHYYLRQ